MDARLQQYLDSLISQRVKIKQALDELIKHRKQLKTTHDELKERIEECLFENQIPKYRGYSQKGTVQKIPTEERKKNLQEFLRTQNLPDDFMKQVNKARAGKLELFEREDEENFDLGEI